MELNYHTFKLEAAHHHTVAERRRIAETRKQKNRTKNSRKNH